jgi:hypothetical protein
LATNVRVLGALLMNPPTGKGLATHRHLAGALQSTGCDEYQIANLLIQASSSFDDLEVIGADEEGWFRARGEIQGLLSSSEEVLLGWGLARPTGAAGANFHRQVEWVWRELHQSRHQRVWLVGGQPRHPSRWHQYVSDRYGRTNGGPFDSRMMDVLQPRLLKSP